MSSQARLIELFADALVRLRRPIIPTVIAALILFGGTTAVFGTTGLALAGQQRTIERLNSPEGRLITVTDAQGTAGLSPASVAAVARLSGVQWVVGIGPATDFGNAALPNSTTVPARALYGDIPPAIHVTTQPADGQALSGPGLEDALGLGDGVGAIRSRTRSVTVVGSFVADTPLTELNDNVLIGTSEASGGRLFTLWVSAADIGHLSALADAVSATVVAHEPGSLRIETSGDLAQLSDDVITEMARTARLTITGVLLTVALLVAAVQFGRVTAMSRDIGRRRALGATRNSILIQVLLNAALCATIGTGAGVATGLALTAAAAKALPPVSFTFGVAVLMILSALAGTLPPAIRAARLDPVRILRVP